MSDCQIWLACSASYFLGAPRQFATRQGFQHQRGDESIAEQRDLFGFIVIHRVGFSPGFERTGKGGGGECGAAAVGNQPTRPAQQVLAEAVEQEAVGGDPAGGFEPGERAMNEVGRGCGLGQGGQRGGESLGLEQPGEEEQRDHGDAGT
jgi:hypothetical protein